MNVVEPHRLERIEVEIGEVGHAIEPAGGIGPAETGMARDRYLKAFGEAVHIGRPVARAARAMEEQEPGPGSSAQNLDGAAVDVDRFARVVDHGRIVGGRRARVNGTPAAPCLFNPTPIAVPSPTHPSDAPGRIR